MKKKVLSVLLCAGNGSKYSSWMAGPNLLPRILLLMQKKGDKKGNYSWM